jgi:hypothetical protein
MKIQRISKELKLRWAVVGILGLFFQDISFSCCQSGIETLKLDLQPPPLLHRQQKYQFSSIISSNDKSTIDAKLREKSQDNDEVLNPPNSGKTLNKYYLWKFYTLYIS